MANHHAAVLPLALDFGPDPGPAGAMDTELLLPRSPGARAGISDAHRRAGEEDVAAHAGAKERFGRAGQGRHPAAAPGEAAERGAPGDPPSGRQARARRRGDLRCAPGRAAPPLRSG